MTTVEARRELGVCPTLGRLIRPRHAFTFYFNGRSMKWVKMIIHAEKELQKFKHGEITTSQLNRMFKSMLDRYYKIYDVKDHGDTIIVRLAERSICKILNGENVRVYDDGTTN